MQHEATIKLIGVVTDIKLPMTTSTGKTVAKCRLIVTRGKPPTEKNNTFFINFWEDAIDNIHRLENGGTYEVNGYFEITSFKDKQDKWVSYPTLNNPNITPIGLTAQPSNEDEEDNEEIPF